MNALIFRFGKIEAQKRLVNFYKIRERLGKLKFLDKGYGYYDDKF